MADPPPQIIGTVDQTNGYAGLVEILRARIAELNAPYDAIDERAGIAKGYTSKCLCAVPIKALGLTSLGPLLGALGLRLRVEIDPTVKISLPVRKLSKAALGPGVKLPIAPAVRKAVRPVVLSEAAYKAAKARWDATTPEQRKIALKYVRAQRRK